MDNVILLGQVKRKLNITWEDPDTNKQVEELFESAIPTLKKKLGIPASLDFDFSVASTENMLFKNYCLYEWNHCVNEFDDNYSNDVAQVRAEWLVKYSKEGGENAEI